MPDNQTRDLSEEADSVEGQAESRELAWCGCGGTGVGCVNSDKIHKYFVKCNKCGQQTAYHGDFSNALFYWNRANTRPQPSHIDQELVEAFELLGKIQSALAATSEYNPEFSVGAFCELSTFKIVSDWLAKHQELAAALKEKTDETH
jgi:hypothetical protein